MPKLKFKPSKGRILVRLKSAKQVTESGLIIPDSAQVPQVEATVLVSDDSRYPKGMVVVLTNKFAGTVIHIGSDDKSDLRVIRVDEDYSEILGTMEEK